MNIDEIDFKHLRLLDAIYRKRSLSEAARMLDIPQPTASHSLTRLRKAFDDDLLVRARGGMEPTQRLIAIVSDIEQILNLKRNIADGGSDFSPSRLEREFVIACSDVGQMLVSTAFCPAVRAEAPHASLRAVTLRKEEMVDALESGEVDIALGSFPDLSAGIHTQSLYTESYRCFALPDHPFVKSGKLADFKSAGHVIVSTKGLAHSHRIAEHTLADILDPHCAHICVGSFLVAIITAAQLNLVVTTPRRIIEEFSHQMGLANVAPPFEVGDFHVNQYWHSRESADPAHQWLRQCLFRSCQGLRG